VQWSRVYRDLSLAYGWTPAQINQLTLVQVCVYLGVPLKGDRVRMSVDRFNSLQTRRAARAKATGLAPASAAVTSEDCA
jgi:hypothetical protein